MALSLSFRLALPVTLVLVALTPLQTQATCLDDYLASIRNAQATGDYSHYAQLAAVYTSCLAGGGGAASAASDITALAMAQATAVGSPGCLGPYLAGIYAAGASGDYTQYAKLAAMYTACLAGGGTAAGATSTASAAAAAGASAGGGSVVQQNCASANAAAVANAQRAGDATALANLQGAYQSCLAGRKLLK